MRDYLEYVAEVSVIFSLLFAGFWVLGRSTSFHRLNRFLLLGIMAVALLMPGLELPPLGLHAPESPTMDLLGVGASQDWLFSAPLLASADGNAPSPWWSWLHGLYLIGAGLMVLRFSIGLLRVRIRLKRSRRTDATYGWLWLSQEAGGAFSFFHLIVMPTEVWRSQGSDMVLAHELAHVRQGHSWDLLFAELVLISFWFNPLIWLWQRHLRSVHEYLADAAVLAQGHDIQAYLRLIAKYIPQPATARLAHSFHSPLILNRLHMITSPPSRTSQKLRYFFLLPLLGLLSLALDFPEQSPAPARSLAITVEAFDPSLLSLLQGSDIPNMKPIAEEDISYLSSGFGMRKHPQTHKLQQHTGVDFVAPAGTPILATADGQVLEAQSYPYTWGDRIVIQHGTAFQTIYAHMQEMSVEAGQSVRRGQVIGYVGNTGMSLGPHLHYEVHRAGKPIDPEAFFGEK